ncbi:MAG: hypothetical protein AAFZ92_01535 [Pseudomonadota bacterium]
MALKNAILAFFRVEAKILAKIRGFSCIFASRMGLSAHEQAIHGLQVDQKNAVGFLFLVENFS